jgi:hypothetical protein
MCDKKSLWSRGICFHRVENFELRQTGILALCNSVRFWLWLCGELEEFALEGYPDRRWACSQKSIWGGEVSIDSFISRFCFIEWGNKDDGSFWNQSVVYFCEVLVWVVLWAWGIRADWLIDWLKVSLLEVMNSRGESVRLLQTRIELLCTSVRFWL